MSVIVNRRDLDFILFDVLKTERLFEADRFSDFDRDAVQAILDTAEKIATISYLPIASEMDEHEPRFENGRAVTHPSLKPALQAFANAGFLASSFDEDLGGMQLPLSIQTAVNGMFSCANLSAHNYSMLTIGAANLLNTFATEAQRQKFLPPMLEGRWFGTMCLSEPQAGSSLSDIRTQATPRDDGRYDLSGSKMWISGGDQDLSENIIHMVLARIPGGPPGVKGISLFIVPKVLINDDGSLGADNNISLAGLNHKMGNRGTTNTLLNFGEAGACIGELVGKPHQGLKYMFQMMNEARIGVGHGACMLGLAGYLHSLDYAKNRPQGRLPTDKNPTSPQVDIIHHADVKRLLLAQKAYVEGAISLVFYCARLSDELEVCEDENQSVELSALLDLLTPIAKSWPSEFCLEANKHAMQVLGGYGYTRDYPVERFYRDNRLNPIHEGTHAIHGLDLLGRKVRINQGAALKLIVQRMEDTLDQEIDHEAIKRMASELRAAVNALIETTAVVLAADDTDRELANASTYLDAFGHIVIAWLWLEQAQTASLKIQGADQADPFYIGKISAASYFYEFELPKALVQLGIVKSMSTTCLMVEPEQFIGS